MKRVIVILFTVFAAGALLQAATASSKSDSMSILGPDGAVFFAPGTDAKKLEDKMAEALVRIEQAKLSNARLSNAELSNAELSRNPTVNSTLNNSINSSLGNSSLLNPSAAKVNDVNKDRLNVGSFSKGGFNGYYGMTATRHEIGKSDIDSRMFLSGKFEMDKTVQFQDQGI